MLFSITAPRREGLYYVADHEIQGFTCNDKRVGFALFAKPTDLPEGFTCVEIDMSDEAVLARQEEEAELEAAIRAEEDAETFEDW